MKKLILLSCLLAMAIIVHAQDIMNKEKNSLLDSFAQDKLLIDSKTKEEVILKVASIMQEKYVFADIGKKMAKYIKQQHDKGEYNSFSEVKPFCKKLTSDLREISNDKHLFVFYSPEEAKEIAWFNNLLPPEEMSKMNAYFEEIESRENFGFRKLEILAGNIGYLDIEYVSGSVNACSKVDNIMGFLENTNAVIIDLRDNGGGGGSGADQILMSYFFGEKKVPFSGVYYRENDSITEAWSNPNVKGSKLPNTDLYILTSAKTFSAAEFMAYSLQALNRATIVGETTKGGAHPINVFIVKDAILTQVSIGNSVNPITGTNWEGVGVQPQVAVKSEDALKTAHLLSLKKIIEKIADEEYKNELKEIIKKTEEK